MGFGAVAEGYGSGGATTTGDVLDCMITNGKSSVNVLSDRSAFDRGAVRTVQGFQSDQVDSKSLGSNTCLVMNINRINGLGANVMYGR